MTSPQDWQEARDAAADHSGAWDPHDDWLRAVGHISEDDDGLLPGRWDSDE